MSFAGTSSCDYGAFLFWKMVAVVQSGNGVFANAFGVGEATATFNPSSDDTEWEFDGNYTD